MRYWLYDIETSHWDELVTACAVCDDGTELVLDDGRGRKDKAERAAAWYFSLPKSDIVLAHNGGGFDFIQLVEACQRLRPDKQWTARMAGANVVSCRAKGHAECRDTSRLFPGSLAKWTGSKTDTGLDCVCGQSCGGYCAIRRGLPPKQREWLLEYNLNDCRIALRQFKADIQRLEGEGLAIFDRHGLPRLTFGAVAWHTARQLREDGGSEAIAWRDYDAGRRAYFGGRCEVGRTWLPSFAPFGFATEIVGHRYDVHAMYPWALTLPVPFGRRTSHTGEVAARLFRRGTPGVYHASVDIPETDWPLLPHRYAEARGRERLHRGRLLWSTGRVDGWWTQIELAIAEGYGARILKIDACSTWADFEPVYAPYVEAIYAARDRARNHKDERWAGVLKWYANALSGKLAQRPDSFSLVIDSEIDREVAVQSGLRWLGGNLFARKRRQLSPCSRPVEAAYLTSRARAEKLLPRLIRNAGHVLYCDTDSTYLTRRDDTDVHASQLGSWGYEGEARKWRALAPKLYRYEDEAGARYVRARGIPRPTWDTIDELERGATVRREIGVDKLRSSVERGGARGVTFQRRVLERSHHDIATGRVGTRFERPDGSTRPLHRRPDGEYV